MEYIFHHIIFVLCLIFEQFLTLCCSCQPHILRINCGGKSVTVNGSTYDDDSDTATPARFHQSGTNWGFKSGVV